MEKPEMREGVIYYWNCPECGDVNGTDDENDSFLKCNGEACDYIYDEEE